MNIKKKIIISSVFLVFFGGYIIWEKERIDTKISGHPDPTVNITLDAEKIYEFKVPTDATKLREPYLIGNKESIYNNYVQSENFKYNFKKNKYYSKSTTSESENYLDVVPLPDGNFLALTGESNYYQGHKGYNAHGYLSILDANGKEDLSTHVYLDPNPKWDLSTASRRGPNLTSIEKKGDQYIVYNRNDSEKYTTDYSVYKYDADSKKINVVARKKLNVNEVDYVNRLYNQIHKNKEGELKLLQGQIYSQMGKEANPDHIYFYNITDGKASGRTLLGKPELKSIAPEKWGAAPGIDGWSLTALEKTNFGYVGVVTQGSTTVQKNKSHVITWGPLGKIESIWSSDGVCEIQTDVSDESAVYVYDEFNSKLNKVTGVYEMNLVYRFPENTKITVNKSSIISDKKHLLFAGAFSKYTDEFEGISKGSDFIIGNITDNDSNNELYNVGSLGIDTNVGNTKVVVSNGNTYVFGGQFGESKDTEITSPYVPKERPEFTNKVLFNFKQVEDYPPAIISLPNKKINIKTKNIESELLTDTNVYDSHEREFALVSKTQKWLDNRVNRNPNTLKYADDGETLSTLPEDVEGNKIDWEALGFDRTKPGPQLVTYFVTDSQKQSTSTSRWVHAVDSHVSESETTVDSDKLYLRAENISINKKDVSAITNQTIWEATKAKVWQHNLTKDEETIAQPYEEDHEFNDEEPVQWGYQFNDKQLKEIKEAKEEKPYPLDVSYTHRRSNQTVTHRIWVFVTNDQTTVDKENDVVMYVNDYARPLHEAKNETKEKMWGYTEGIPAVGEVPAKPAVPGADVKVYDYQDTYDETTELPTIADKSEGKQTGLGVNGTYLTAINQAVKDDPNNPGYPEYPAQITYTKDGKISKANLTVTLEQKQADVTIQFHDEDGERITNEKGKPIDNIVLKDQNIEEEIDLTKEPLIKEVLDGVNKGNGYQVIGSPTSHIVKTEAKENVVTYVFEGQINFGTVTNELTFQQGFIKPNNQTLEYNSKEDFVVNVADNRNYKEVPATGDRPKKLKKRGNFDVQVKLTQPFKHNGEEGQVKDQALEGAVLRYTPESSELPIDITGAEAATVTRSTQTTTEPDKKQFSLQLDNKDKSSKTGKGWSLFVPQGNVQKGTYVAELTWYLSTGP